MNNKKRAAAAASAIAVVGTLITVAPATTTTAEARTVAVKKNTAKEAKQTRKRVVRVARAQVGKQYRTAGVGPRVYDCSGLMYYSYKRATGKTLPRTSWAQKSGTKRVSRHNLKKGDLLHFRGGGHVGMYIGNNKFVHASNPRTDVRIDRLSGYWGGTFNGATRVIFKK